jgi:hypothetical protein
MSHIVEDALDRYIVSMAGRKGIDPGGVRAATLAALMHITVDEMSMWLQDYRRIQGSSRRQTRYTIACEGYGRIARWKIMAKPGSHPNLIEKNHRDHANWITWDAFQRFLRDTGLEIDPALRGHDPAADAQIKTVLSFAAQQMTNSMNLAKSLLANSKTATQAQSVP